MYYNLILYHFLTYVSIYQEKKMLVNEFDYYLPEELIAQTPISKRDESRLLVLNKKDGLVEHSIFKNIIDYFEPGDCLVLNDSKVIPARLHVNPIKNDEIDSNCLYEVFIIKQISMNQFECIVHPGKKFVYGKEFDLNGTRLKVSEVKENGNRIIDFSYNGDFFEIIKKIGEVPLPPYIHSKINDPNRYQTIYAKHDGSVAAPTAGLHFTDDVFRALKQKGVSICYITLHVGIGTFRPVKVDKIEDHIMHSESFSLSAETCDIINKTKQSGHRVFAVGTTVCRTLESVANSQNASMLFPDSGCTDIFIYPGFNFKVIDCLITNFHLPKSTLIMLVSAFAGKENVMNAYNIAVKNKYRFFSFGDAMLIK